MRNKIKSIIDNLFYTVERKDLAQHAIAICANPHTKANILLNYASFHNPKVIDALLNNLNTPSKALDIISKKQDYRYALAVLKHINVTQEIVQFLQNHENQHVREKALLTLQKIIYQRDVEARFI